MLPFGIGLGEVLLILVVILLVVGPRKLPEMAKTVGKGLRTVRKAGRELRDAVDLDDMRQQVYQPIRQWEQQQRIEEAQLIADEEREARERKEKKARERMEREEQAKIDRTHAALEGPDPASLHRDPVAPPPAAPEPSPAATPPPAADADDPDDDADGPMIVARTPDSVYKKARPGLLDPPKDDGKDPPG